MSGEKLKGHIVTTSMGTTTSSSAANQPRRRPIVQNFVLVWVDSSIDQLNKDCQETLAQLRSIVNDVIIFTEPDQCIQFLKDINNERVFVIVSGLLSERLVPDIHTMSQLDAIYILCSNQSQHEQWAKNWPKIKGIHTVITPICKALQLASKQCNEDNISISFVSVGEEASSENLNQLEASYMYTQISKEILLEMKFDAQSVKNLVSYCRTFYKDNNDELYIINVFERDYRPQLSIWWYTRECFIYQMLNAALRNLEGDIVINMGFLIYDLHRQIEQLHQKQVSAYHGKPFNVYRGQSLSTAAFEKLRKTQGGLMSFNCFLSTSKKRDVSMGFAEDAIGKTKMVGILFQMSIDPSISSTPFASIQEVSYFKTEEEILFSMHTIFRIGAIKQIDTTNPLYQVELQLTSGDDPQIRRVTECLREETEGSTGWARLVQLLLTMRQPNKAEELYTALLEQTLDEDEKVHYCQQLGCIKEDQGEYKKAIEYHEKGVEIRQKSLPPNHPDLAISYNDIGLVYDSMGEYPKALSFHEKALEIREKSLLPNHPDLAISYNNIGSVYNNMGEYPKALLFYEKTLEIEQKSFPPNHPSLAISYSNIGLVYDNMGEYSKALSFHEKALEIREKSLPPNHPSLAISYNNIGLVYDNMEEYPKALSFHEKTLEIEQKSLPPNHPSLAISYSNIGSVYDNIQEYPKALLFYEKSLEILEKSDTPNHSELATCHDNIGSVYDKMEEYSKALSFYEKALETRQKILFRMISI